MDDVLKQLICEIAGKADIGSIDSPEERGQAALDALYDIQELALFHATTLGIECHHETEYDLGRRSDRYWFTEK